MHLISLLISLLSILVPASLGIARPTAKHWETMRTKHSWHSIPERWQHHGHPHSSATIDLRIALKPHRESALIDVLDKVSDPKHPKYGMHLSKDQVAKLVAPHPDALELVSSWLTHHGVHSSSVSITHGGGWLTLSKVPLAQANALLGASYQLYRHIETNEVLLRTISYALPTALHEHIETVAPTTYFSSLHALWQNSRLALNGPTLLKGTSEPLNIAAAVIPDATAPPPSSDIVTPTVLRRLYNTENYEPRSAGKNKLGIVGYLQQFASQSDLTTFMGRFRPDADLGRAMFSVVSVNGGINDQNHPTAEGNLDIQYAESISYPTPNIYYSTGGSPPFNPDSWTPTNSNEPYLDWLDFILGQSAIPQTISTSYGDDEQTVPEDYATSICNLFAQLGARGVSVLFASGDFGVGGGSCLSNNGASDSMQFIPIFPASCPFVTTVGGTLGVDPEIAASLSGGGFSNYFPRPSYQDGPVSAYLQSIGSMYSGLYNRSGRGYPDISAQAVNFQVVLGGKDATGSGTSCSAPTAAGVISLLNDFLISRNKPPLGFLNPWIYSTAATGFNDVTSGSNPGCGTSGFSAIEGWDPVTGFGTPNFSKLQGLVG